MEKGIVTKKKIKFNYKSSSGLDSRALSSFVKFVYKNFELGTEKGLVHKLVDGFECKYKSKRGVHDNVSKRRFRNVVRRER